MFINRVCEFEDKTLFGFKNNSHWETLSFNEVYRRISDLSRSLVQLKHTPPTQIALLMENGPNWVITDLAIMSSGHISVPIYTTNTASQTRYILDHSEAKLLFVSSTLLSQDLLDEILECKTLEKIIIFDDQKQNTNSNAKICNLEEFLTDQASLNQWFETIDKIKPDDTCTIIYTSGTTAHPKGVMLSHKNIISNIESCLDALTVGPSDRSLSFLPLSHALERTAGIYTLMSAGCEIYFAQSLAKVSGDLLEVNPTVFCAVPRLLEKAYNAVYDKVKQSSWFIQRAFQYANQHPETPLNMLFDRLFYKKIREKFGQRLRFIVSGGAALSPGISEFFSRAGLTILQGYGLTESSPVVSVNRLKGHKSHTVGQILKNVEVQIAPDGEVLIRGPNVMKGYFKDPQASALAIRDDGFLLSGDIGKIDEDGHIQIVDRKKDIIVTSGGKNIAPSPIENQLVLHELIEQACIIGDDRKFLSVLIVPNIPLVQNKANALAINCPSTQALLQDPTVKSWFEQIIHSINENKSNYESIKKFSLSIEPFTQESGELTPTMKLKRRIIAKNRKESIDDMYNSQ